MKAKDLLYVLDTVENEGFGYAFIDYSDFKDIDDPEFHKLREAYCAAHKALAEYIGLGEWEVTKWL